MSINVPQLGFEYDFVMHGILALAGLHLAKCSPQRKDLCLSRAILHHEAGLKKASLVLAEYTEENCHALWIFTALTLLYTVGSTILHKSDNFILVGEAGIAEWIVLSRQSYSIVRISTETLRVGPLGPMLSNGARRAGLQNENPPDNFHGAQNLREIAVLIDQSTLDFGHREAYSSAIHQLRKVYCVVSAMPSEDLEMSDIFIWPYRYA
jgi:hypothetical protein